jgi:NAD(P)H-dependent flavin oxidoreductase YrpB (nitropropane dioxygenase family)
MSLKPMIAVTAIAIGISSMAGIVATPAHAQDAAEAEIIGFHQLCQKGDRRACVRFGILIGRNEQLHADWRRAHADWWWWEH